MASTPPEEPAPEQQDIFDVNEIVTKLEDLVKFSLECEQKELRPDISFVEVHKKLLQIQKDIQQFQDSYKQNLALFNLTPEDVRPTPEQIESLDPKQRKLLERMQTLQSTCENERDRLYQSMQTDQDTLKQVKKELKGKEREKTHRKGKFKGIGGKQGWIPS